MCEHKNNNISDNINKYTQMNAIYYQLCNCIYYKLDKLWVGN